MSTGYTEAIKDGMLFREFALRCSRAFGALITMRDEPSDAPIKLLVPSDWHKDKAEEARKELKEISNVTIEQFDNLARIEYNKEAESNRKSMAEARELQDKYQSMLEKVLAWTPPTNDHVELKEFMIKQIKSSMDFDDMTRYYKGRQSILKSGAEYKSQLVQKLIGSISYHEKEYAEKVSRTDGRNKWISALLASLKDAEKMV